MYPFLSEIMDESGVMFSSKLYPPGRSERVQPLSGCIEGAKPCFILSDTWHICFMNFALGLLQISLENCDAIALSIEECPLQHDLSVPFLHFGCVPHLRHKNCLLGHENWLVLKLVSIRNKWFTKWAYLMVYYNHDTSKVILERSEHFIW